MNLMSRKDVLLIALITLSCVMFAVSRPDSMDVRSVVWDLATIIVMAAVFFWFVTEIMSWIGGTIVGEYVPVPTNGMSKNGLVVLAHNEGIADKETLDKLSEEELVTLINTNGRSKRLSQPSTIFVVSSGVWNLFKEVIHALVAKFRWIAKVLKNLQKRLFGRRGKDVKKRK
jgi:hypothetical protein